MLMNTATTPPASASLSRRGFFMKIGLLFNGFAAIVVALPLARFLFPPSLVVAGMAICRGCPWATSATFLRERRGWLLFAIPWSCQLMERLSTPRAGCAASPPINSRCLRLTARISAAPSVGSRNLVFLCVPVMVARTTATVHARLGRRSVGSSNIHTKSKTVCSRSTRVSCQLLATRWQV
jgi:hypothetical protein